MSARFLDRRLAREAGRSRLPLALTIVLGTLGGILLVAQARLLSLTVSRAFLEAANLPAVAPLLWALLAAAGVRALATWGAEVAAAEVAVRARTDLRGRLFAQLLALGPAYAREERAGELVSTATDGIEALDPYFSQYLPQIALSAVVPLAILVFVFPLDPLSGLILLLTAPLIPLFMVLIGSASDELARRQWGQLSRLNAHFLDVLQGLPTLKLFGRSHIQARIISEISDRHRAATMGVLRVAFLSALALELLATMGTAVVAVEVGLRLLYGRLTFEQAFFVLILAPEFYLPLRQLAARFHAGVSGSAAADRIFEILETQPAVSGVVAPESSAVIAPPEISFEGVTVRHSGATQPALEDVSLSIPAGETLALVGPSGAGKSTIAELLLRFAEPSSGRIMADAAPLSATPQAAWRARVAWAPQRPYLFDRSVADNIRLGKPAATAAAVEAAAMAADAHAFISALPQGYHTRLGERAARLSGGQAQRIALARAFLKDAPLVILDEATANLDPLVEVRVQAAVRHLLEGRTGLLIAHRLNTVRSVESIAVLQRGRIVEQGGHTDLLAAGGAYARLIAAAGCAADEGAPATEGPERDAGGGPERQEEGLPVTLPEAEQGSLRGRSSAFSIVARLLRFLIPVWPWMALSVGLGFATIISSIGLLGTSAWLISNAALRPSIAELQVAIVGVRFFGISRALLRYAERLISHQTTFRILSRLRVWFYEAVEPLSPAGLARLHSADLMARAVSDVAVLENFYGRVVAPPLVALFISAFIGLWFIRYGLSLAICAVSFLVLSGALGSILAWRLASGRGRDYAEIRARLHVDVAEGIQGMADLMAFNAEGGQARRLHALGQSLAGLQRKIARRAGLTAGLNALLPPASAAALLALAIPEVRAGQLAGINLAVIVMSMFAAFEAIWPLSAAAQQLEASLESARRLFDVAVPPADRPPPAAVSEPPEVAGEEPPAVRLAGVRFRYNPDEAWALDGVSFDVPRGACVAIVGPSGAGKSTLVNLLARFWDADAGQILMDGRDTLALDPAAVRSQLGVSPQDTHLFNATIHDNLHIARSDATRAEMEAAARAACADDFIAALPQGYDTPVGEQGSHLSGGERQRIAIARALLKDAPLLVLDEPTSGLDPVTESAVMERLKEALRGRTALIITHRLAVARSADIVIVLRDGRVVQQGPHDVLIGEDGLYRNLWLSQCAEVA